MINKTCKICNREALAEFLSFEKYPNSISKLFKNQDLAKSDFSKISFQKCNYCQHVQLASDTPQSFYEEYVMTVSHSNKMVQFQKKQAHEFVSMFNLKGKNVLEVGCGDGHFLNILKSMECNVYGNEPSKPFRELALKRGLSIDENFVDENYSHPKGPFDAIVSRQVMEHVPDPVYFLKNIKKNLKNDGAILIEIPNFEKTLSELRYYDMFSDHINYFTSESLTTALLIAGFVHIDIKYGMDNEFLYAYAKNNTFDGHELKNAYFKISNDLKTISNNFKHIVVWGAGGKGIATLGSLDDISPIKYVVDSDPFKQNYYLPSSGLIVHSPEYLFKDILVDALIITNLAYTDEIIGILKEKKVAFDIFVLSKNGISSIKL